MLPMALAIVPEKSFFESVLQAIAGFFGYWYFD